MSFRSRNEGALLAGALLFVFVSALSAASIPGDAQAGKELFTSQKCSTCHSVSGAGGKTASDLGKATGRGYTPQDMVAAMWNHAPQMFPALEKAGIAKPALSPAQAADLFAYFYAARFFEKPGDAGRGRKLFASKGCADCHIVSGAGQASGPRVTAWMEVTNPIELARRMWNHAPAMRAEMQRRKVNLPTLTAAEMTDIVVYLKTIPPNKEKQPEFAPASAETGALLFKVKGCQGCHRDGGPLVKGGAVRSSAEFAAAMWNHSAKMADKQQPLRAEEMTRLTAYLWALQFGVGEGNAARGKTVVTAKGCVTCHTQGFKLAAQAGPFEAVAAVWSHAPDMLKAMQQKNVKWPRFTGAEVTDLLAYVNKK